MTKTAKFQEFAQYDQTADAFIGQFLRGEIMSFLTSNPSLGLTRPISIFIKPNWVAGRYRESCSVEDSIWSTITHPFVIESVIRAVHTTLHTDGRDFEIIVGDNPSIDADFSEILLASNFPDRVGDLKNVSFLDLRPLVCSDLRWYGQREKMTSQLGDPKGPRKIDLAESSLFSGIDPSNFRGVFDDTSNVVAAHSDGQHLYEFSGSIIDSDIYISVPKLKTHHKVGVTLNLKGLVGASFTKDFLVHWRNGYPDIGGDEYPDRETFEYYKSQTLQKRGAWPGNDTIWRMVVDLFHGFEKLRVGKINLSIIDGIVGGEGEGPFCPKLIQSGVLVAGNDLLLTDLVGTRLMGFNPSKVPYLNHFLEDDKNNDLAQVYSEITSESHDIPHFAPPSHWRGIL